MTDTKTLSLFEPEHKHRLTFYSMDVLNIEPHKEELKPCAVCDNINVDFYYWECDCGIEKLDVICWHCHMDANPKLGELHGYKSVEEAITAWDGNSTANLTPVTNEYNAGTT